MRNFSTFERPLPDLFIINNLDIYIFVFFNRQNWWKSYCVIIFQILILMGHRVQTKTERVKIACMLLEFGAKLDQRNKKGQQAIDLAETDVKSAVQQHANDVWVFATVGKGGYGFKHEFGDGGNSFLQKYSFNWGNFYLQCWSLRDGRFDGTINIFGLIGTSSCNSIKVNQIKKNHVNIPSIAN